MSCRAIARETLPGWCALVLVAGGVARGQGVRATATPGNININYLQGAALPAAQTISVTASMGPATYTAAVPGGVLWLTASPDSGALPAKVSLRANPTGLAVGTYNAAVVFTPVVAGAPGSTATTNVKLIVTQPPPVLTLSANALTFTNPPAPAAQMVR